MAGITNERMAEIDKMNQQQLQQLAVNHQAVLTAPAGVTDGQRDTANDEMAAVFESARRRGLTVTLG